MKISADKILEEVEKKGLMDKPYRELTEKERGLIVTANILRDSESADIISLRDYCFFYHDKPSYILKLIKPYLHVINEELVKKGFVRVSKYTWRKFTITINERKLEELAKKLKLSEDEAYILAVAYKLLKITIPFVKDWKGFNIFDGFKILNIFDKLSKKGVIDKEDIEKIGQRLLKYEEQIRGLGLDFDRIKKVVGGRFQ